MFVPGKPFQPSLVFDGKDRSLSYSKVPERFVSWVGLALPTNIRLSRLARHKHSSSLWKSVNYSRDKFYDTGPGANVKKIPR